MGVRNRILLAILALTVAPRAAAAQIAAATTGAVASTPPQGGTADYRFRVGAGVELNHYYNWNAVVGDQRDIATNDGDTDPLGVVLSLEWTPFAASNVMVGGAVHYNRQSFTQTYASSDPLIPTRAQGDVNAWFFDGYVGYGMRWKHYEFHLAGGGTLAWDELRLESGWAPGTSRTTRRTNTALMGRFGAGVDVPVAGNVGLRFCTNYTTAAFKDGNADDHFGFVAGMTLQF